MGPLAESGRLKIKQQKSPKTTKSNFNFGKSNPGNAKQQDIKIRYFSNVFGVQHLAESELTLADVCENNILVASWIDDAGCNQKYEDDKLLFYNNENILNRSSVYEHFSSENKSLFSDRNIEFSSKKGYNGYINQDNFFTLIDGDVKIYGLFDGHGVNGHLISGFAMGTMLDYIKHSKQFSTKDLQDATATQGQDAEITKAIRCCFKYT